MSGRKVIILAGGLDQVELVKRFKSEGYEVHVVDYTPNAMAAEYADIHHLTSTLDVDAVSALAKELQAELVVTACTDQALCVAAEVSEKLKLPFPISFQQAKNLTNKEWMKEVLVNNDIPSAKYKIFEKKIDSEFSFTFPVVVKPVDSNSSKGVSRVDSIEELDSAFNDALSHSRSETVIVEEFMTGKELSIDGFVDSSQRARLLLVTENVILSNRKDKSSFPISASVYPVIKDSNKLQEIESLLQKIADVFEIKNCPLLVQAIMDDAGNIKVIELSARTGGGLKHKLIHRITGIDIISYTVDSFCRKETELEPFELVDEHIVVRYLFVNNGEFKAVSGFDEDYGEKLYISKMPGAKIKGNSTSTEVIGNLIISAKCKQELIEKISAANNELAILDSFDNNILVKDSVFSEIAC